MASDTLSDERPRLVRVVKEEHGERVEMLCPKCEEWQDILAYKNPDIVKKFASSLNPIVKCMRCKHLFAPRWLSGSE